jgi:hypothetical protein
MSGKTAKKIRKALKYDAKNANPIQKRTYNTFKKHYTRMPAPYKAAMINQLSYKS